MSLLSTDIVSAYACVLLEGEPGRYLQELIPEQAAGNVPGTVMVSRFILPVKDWQKW